MQDDSQYTPEPSIMVTLTPAFPAAIGCIDYVNDTVHMTKTMASRMAVKLGLTAIRREIYRLN